MCLLYLKLVPKMTCMTPENSRHKTPSTLQLFHPSLSYLAIPEHRNLRLRLVGLWFRREQLVAGDEGRADGQRHDIVETGLHVDRDALGLTGC